MSVFIPEEEEIYFSKTREYFKEVMSSYSNGNYRSALVMLYSVVICDMLLKLQELKDMYNDSIATSILEFYKENALYSKNGSKSAWEKEFIEKIYSSTELLNLEAYTHLNHLYDDRNFSAHPALDSDFELISPSKETTLSHIKNALNDSLTKPPLFLKNIVETLTEDLDKKRDVFKGNNEDLKVYLENRYFSKMSNPMRLKVFKAFWKFVFILANDEKCDENRNINRHVIEFLVKNSNEEFFKLLKNDGFSFEVDNNSKCVIQLVMFLASCPQVYHYLNDTTKLQLNKSYEHKPWLKCLCWYEFKSLKEHLEYLYDKLDVFPTSYDGMIPVMINNYKEANLYSELLDFYVYCFGNSKKFDDANWYYSYLIKPYFKDFSKKQYCDIFEKINSNSQLYKRGLARSNNTELYKSAIELYGNVFNIESYKNFIYNEEVITEDDDALPF